MNTDSRTQAIILLTIPFKGDKANLKTLNINEYNKVSELLKVHNAVPEDLLENKFLSFFLNEINKSIGLKNMSMGMSADYLDAIKHESTFVRIGSSIFGSRS